ncbi:MAG: substrate-binding domain-containing protein [Wenzhouxiangellaceae bacterium]|nr:substrate-binding domain-containing protein [Wenzhouxiangellaceae bacterium]
MSKERPVGDKPEQPRRLTMADLARMAGVSPITVSRAMADSPRVHERTKARIQGLAREHGYAMNVSARNLRLRQSHTIAVLVEMTPSAERPMSGSYPLDLLGGITQELTAAGYSLLLSAGHESTPGPPRGAEGVILLGQGAGGAAVGEAEAWRLPLVVWGAVSADDPHVVVGSDNRGGGAAVARRFIELGRTRPCFLGDLAYQENAERFAGFRAELNRNGLEPLLVNQADFTTRAGSDAMRGLLASDERSRPDAVFACNDLMAIGAIQAIREFGLSIPDHITVVGYDDTALGAGMVPALTTVHQDLYQGGILLARKVLQRIHGDEVESEMMPVEIVIRES